MLAVHRQDSPAQLPGLCHDQLTCHHQSFLVGQGNILACLQCRHGRLQPGKAHQGSHHHIPGRISRRLNYRPASASQLRPALIPFLQPPIGYLIRQHSQLRLKLLYLLFQQLITAVSHQHGHME